jgi:hypothetical protein
MITCFGAPDGWLRSHNVLALSSDTVLVGLPWDDLSLEDEGRQGSVCVMRLARDPTAPTTRAYPADVKKGKRVKLGYRVDDATPGHDWADAAYVTLKIFKAGKLKKAIKLPAASPCNVRKHHTCRCTLAKGRYVFKVYATDLGGNVQSKVGSARLTVK